MKILLTEEQCKFLIKEYIQPNEAENPVDSVLTVCQGKRGVAFATPIRIEDYEEIVELVSDYDLGSLKVPNSKHDAYVIFNRKFEDDAKELQHIAILNNGYLPSSGDVETIRKIGELLSYDPNEIEQFIKNKNGFTQET